MAVKEPIKIFNAPTLLKQGIALFQQGQFNQAVEIANELIRNNANDDEAWHLLGVIHYMMKEYNKAEDYLRKAISINSSKAHYLNSYGLILNEKKRFPEAIEIFKKALLLEPTNVALYNSLGVALKEAGAYEQAKTCYEEALKLDAKNPTTYMNLGVLGIYTEKYDEGMENLRKAEKLNYRDPLIYNNLGACARKMGNHELSAKYSRKALQLKPDLYEAWNNLCATLYEMGEYDKSVEEYTRMLEKYPSDGAKIDLGMLMRQMPQDSSEIDQIRKRLNDNLDAMINSDMRITNPMKEIQHMHFFHAYHGRNDKEIMEKFVKLYLKVCPELDYVAPHCLDNASSANSNPATFVSGGDETHKKKIRIGFISNYFHTHVVSKFFNEPIARLAESGDFEVIAFTPAIRFDEAAKKFAARIHKFVNVPFDIFSAREVIARYKCDVIAYTDIGMNLFTYFMGFSRLAPLQCVLSGHPITTGLKHMDYYVSTKIVEPDNAQEHYTEKLVTLTRNIAINSPPTKPERIKTRAELGLPDDENIRLYSCPVLPHKIHPDFDLVVKEILDRDPNARIVLFRLQQEVVRMLPERLGRKLSPELMERVIFQPFMPQDDYKSFLMNMDCILDPFAFTMGSTAFIVFGLDVPLVTLPGEFLRGRAAYWLYKKMEIEDLIAKDPADYVRLAIKLANDEEFYKSVSERIAAKKHMLYDDYGALAEFKDFLKNAMKEKNLIPSGGW